MFLAAKVNFRVVYFYFKSKLIVAQYIVFTLVVVEELRNCRGTCEW